MKVGFYLNTPKNSTSAIRSITRNKGQRYVISVGESVNPKYWNENTHRCRTVRDYPEASHINTRLDDWAKVIEDAINGFGLVIPTPKMLRDKVNEIIRNRNIEAGGIIDNEEEIYLVTFARKIHKESNVSVGTKKSYMSTINTLIEFEAAHKTKLRFIDVDIDFYRKFEKWMLNRTYIKNTIKDEEGKIIKTIEESYSKNYIGALFKNIIKFMNESKKDKLHNFDGYQVKGFRAVKEETDAIYLDQEEILRIYNIEFTDELLLANNYDRGLQRARESLNEDRDRFLIGCFTGLRHSDYSRLDTLNFDDNIVRIWTKKMDKKVHIPMHYLLREILKRRNNILPSNKSEQKHNEQIKVIGNLAGIDSDVLLTKTRGGERQNIIGKKYEFITSHTARRSGATNMYLAGVDLKFIQDILGHSKMEQTIRYIKVSAEDNAKRLVNHPYFSGKQPENKEDKK